MSGKRYSKTLCDNAQSSGLCLVKVKVQTISRDVKSCEWCLVKGKTLCGNVKCKKLFQVKVKEMKICGFVQSVYLCNSIS